MGTGLDAREKIRNKVTRRGRRHLSKKSNKDTSSSSGSGSSSNSRSGTEGVEENLFDPSSKVRILAEQFPGALTNQGINHMRTSLLQEIGHQDRPNALHPVAVAYTRQHLLKRASAPVQRELLTLSHALDLMLKGKASASADTLMQRLKSIEQTLLGSHWSISQKLEVLPPESASITALPDAKSAQREMYDESRLRWLAASPDGRQGQKGGKSGGKTKGEGKEGRGQEREGKGGKKKQSKGRSGQEERKLKQKSGEESPSGGAPPGVVGGDLREEMEVARATALEANYERGTAVKNGNYEGGVVTAARSPERTGDSLQHLREPDGVLAAAQSMHEAQLPPMEERIPFTKRRRGGADRPCFFFRLSCEARATADPSAEENECACELGRGNIGFMR